MARYHRIGTQSFIQSTFAADDEGAYQEHLKLRQHWRPKQKRVAEIGEGENCNRSQRRQGDTLGLSTAAPALQSTKEPGLRVPIINGWWMCNLA